MKSSTAIAILIALFSGCGYVHSEHSFSKAGKILSTKPYEGVWKHYDPAFSDPAISDPESGETLEISSYEDNKCKIIAKDSNTYESIFIYGHLIEIHGKKLFEVTRMEYFLGDEKFEPMPNETPKFSNFFGIEKEANKLHVYWPDAKVFANGIGKSHELEGTVKGMIAKQVALTSPVEEIIAFMAKNSNNVFEEPNIFIKQ